MHKLELNFSKYIEQFAYDFFAGKKSVLGYNIVTPEPGPWKSLKKYLLKKKKKACEDRLNDILLCFYLNHFR